MERDHGGGSDYGRDLERELGDEPAPAWRDAPPDIRSPIDPNAPVSGHVAPPAASASAAAAPEHHWEVANGMIFPAFRPVGTGGLRVEDIDQARLVAEAAKSHAQPIVDEGPCGLATTPPSAAARKPRRTPVQPPSWPSAKPRRRPKSMLRQMRLNWGKSHPSRLTARFRRSRRLGRVDCSPMRRYHSRNRKPPHAVPSNAPALSAA